MPGEKRKVSDEIVRIIETRANDYIERIDHGQSEQLEEAMAKYQTSVSAFYEEKLARLNDKQSAIEHKEVSALQFEINSNLKRYRSDLLDDFKNEIKEDLKGFVNDKKAYKNYLDACLKTLQPGGIVFVNNDDMPLIEGFEVKTKNMPMGGLVYELENRVYDFSLKTRFEDAIETFINTSKIWIRSDEN